MTPIYLYLSGNNLTDLFDTLNKELVIINQWIQSNKLSVNIEKTNYMIFSHSHKKISDKSIELYLNGDAVSRVNDIKFLGLIIDETSIQRMSNLAKPSSVCTCIYMNVGGVTNVYYCLFIKSTKYVMTSASIL